MEVCKNCGIELEESAKFCPICGAKQESVNESIEEKQVLQNTSADRGAISSEDTQADDIIRDKEAETQESTDVSVESTGGVEKAMNTFKNSNNKKRLMLGAAVLLIAAVGGAGVYASQPDSIMDDLKISFEGYDGIGTVSLSDDYQKVAGEIFAKEVGFSQTEIKAMSSEDFNSSDFARSGDNYAKIIEMKELADALEIDVDKEEGLKNGDKITVSITYQGEENLIKDEKKTFEVSGLKKSTTYTIEELLKEEPIEFVGYNHFGQLKYNKDIFTVSDQSNDSSEEVKYSNGDKVDIALSEYYISAQEEKGKILSGEASKSLEVTGLEESPKISNLSEFHSQLDSVANSYHKDVKGFFTADYTTSRTDTYFIGENINSNSMSYSSENQESEDAAEFSLVSIYKVTKKTSNGEDTWYKVYGYSDLRLKSNKINIAGLGDGQKYNDYTNFETLTEALDALKADYPSLVKMNG